MSELTVVLKDSERTYKQKFLIYSSYKVNAQDEQIQFCISEAKKNFVGKPEEVQIKIHMEVK